MFGFHPLAAQSFASAIPFVDVQTTTNLLSTAVGSSIPTAVTVLTNANLTLAAAQGSVTGNQIISFAIPSGNELAAAINSVAPFTWGNVSDISDQTWSAVSDTGNQTWTQIDDTTNANQTWSKT